MIVSSHLKNIPIQSIGYVKQNTLLLGISDYIDNLSLFDFKLNKYLQRIKFNMN